MDKCDIDELLDDKYENLGTKSILEKIHICFQFLEQNRLIGNYFVG